MIATKRTCYRPYKNNGFNIVSHTPGTTKAGRTCNTARFLLWEALCSSRPDFHTRYPFVFDMLNQKVKTYHNTFDRNHFMSSAVKLYDLRRWFPLNFHDCPGDCGKRNGFFTKQQTNDNHLLVVHYYFFKQTIQKKIKANQARQRKKRKYPKRKRLVLCNHSEHNHSP